MNPFDWFLEALAAFLLAMVGYLLVVFILAQGGPH